MAVRLKKFVQAAAHLIVRKDSVFCCRCGAVLPIRPGDGTPLPSFIAALETAAKKHPPSKHRREGAWGVE